MEEETAIQVHDTPLPDQSWSAVRHVVVAVAAYATGRGWLGDDTATMLLAVAGIVGPIVFAQLKARRRALELATVAKSAPNSIATLRL